MTIRNVLLILFLSIGCFACSDDDNQPKQLIPDVYVNEQINLTNIQYAPLRQDGGYVYIQGGVRGIIVYRQSTNSYIAFERNCPYQPFDDCALVSVDQSRLFMIDSCCKSQFDFSGAVIAGPATLPLKRYSTAITGSTGNFLYITN
ncbi:MAG: hypothetical protein LPJ89_01645 [Hymenobacteraceae bacterium]|nr:hypothetical protein [Hymenobacteraceae bacterium]MDX5395940.1 hypothetical protein [Hymenobacteraceae bacterium]MDX5442466.1 hypothetical protein [Hymenobacteraceae bacterium]MDX5511998.1 hypothetical protein [Hymenobacteraceae bacterium]